MRSPRRDDAHGELIWVIEGGRIVERGAHAELLAAEVFSVGSASGAYGVGHLLGPVEENRDGAFRLQREQRLGGMHGRFARVALLAQAVGLVEGEEGAISGRCREVRGQRVSWMARARLVSPSWV